MPVDFTKLEDVSLVPLGRFRRATDSQADAIIFFRHSHRSLDFRCRAIKSFSQSDVFERGGDINLFRSGDDISSSDIIYKPSGRLKWCFREGESGVDLKS